MTTETPTIESITTLDLIVTPRIIDLLESYESFLRGRGQRPRGIATYLLDLGQFLKWAGADTTVADLTEDRLTDYRDDLAKRTKARTVALRLTILRSFCKWCLRKRYLTEDPTQWVDMPKVHKTAPKPLTRAQLAQLWRAIAWRDDDSDYAQRQRARNRRAILIMLYAGLRLSECCDLRWGDIDLDAGSLTVREGKGGEPRSIPIHPTLALELRRVEDPDLAAPVIENWHGKPISRGTADHIFARWLIAQEGPNITAHQLRHTFATELLRRGAKLIDIQSGLGHANLDTTALYLLADGEHLRAAIDLLPGGW